MRCLLKANDAVEEFRASCKMRLLGGHLIDISNIAADQRVTYEVFFCRDVH